jgi:hypothetical protein
MKAEILAEAVQGKIEEGIIKIAQLPAALIQH